MAADDKRTFDVPGCPGASVWFRKHDPATSDDLTPAQKRAWELRRQADALDGEVSYTYGGNVPATCDSHDFWDALCFGVSAATRFLGDLHRDRKGSS